MSFLVFKAKSIIIEPLPFIKRVFYSIIYLINVSFNMGNNNSCYLFLCPLWIGLFINFVAFYPHNILEGEYESYFPHFTSESMIHGKLRHLPKVT